jgi:glycosyltransferase involved in cell wall biosynthesis
MGRRALRVLIVDHSSGYGGAEESLVALLKATPSGMTYWEAVFPGPGPTPARLGELGFKVHTLDMEGWRWWPSTSREVITLIGSLPMQAASFCRWVQFFRRVAPDLVHFNINRLVEPVLAAWWLGIPSVMHFRDIPSRMSLRFALGQQGFFSLMRKASAWVANSHATFEDVKRHSSSLVREIPNGLDLAYVDRRANEGSGEDAVDFKPPVVAMVANLVPLKRHDLLLDVAARLQERASRVGVLIAGTGNSEYEDALKGQMAEMGLGERVRFLGQVSNVPRLLSRVDALVHTCPDESFGRVFIEAMAARRPVVAFEGGGASDVILDGETGILVPRGNVGAFADAVERLVADEGLRRRMGEAGRQRVAREYTIDRHVASVLALHQEVIAPRGSRPGVPWSGSGNVPG